MKKIIFIAFAFVLLISGCGRKQETMKNIDTGSKNISSSKQDKNSSPEIVVKNLYENKLKLDDEFIKENFYSPEKFDKKLVEQQIKVCNITKITLDNIYNIEKKENYAVIGCADSTYFKDIKEPRRDFQPVALIFKDKKWYILNDLNDIKEEDAKLVAEMIQKYQEKIMKEEEVKNIIKDQDEFIKNHKGFFEEKQKIINKNLMKEKKEEPIDEVQKQQEINEEMNQQMKQQKQIEEGTKKDK